MISSEVQRTLVKSPPELWAELSDPAALARHLGELGEIRITRTDPEKAVEWEAADTTGKVTLAPSGWGTKVTLTVTRELAEVEPAVVPEPEPEPRLGFFARLFRRRPPEEPEETPDVAAEEKAAEEVATEQVTGVLTAALDRLGAAHHRPFSRA